MLNTCQKNRIDLCGQAIVKIAKINDEVAKQLYHIRQVLSTFPQEDPSWQRKSQVKKSSKQSSSKKRTKSRSLTKKSKSVKKKSMN